MNKPKKTSKKKTVAPNIISDVQFVPATSFKEFRKRFECPECEGNGFYPKTKDVMSSYLTCVGCGGSGKK